jgi:RimJ/RimL family protein N-acetyltransferase
MKILYHGLTKSGQKFIIRYLDSSDLLGLWHYINKISAEQSFIRFQGEKISKKDEANFVDTNIKKIKQHQLVFLVVEVDKKICGSAQIGLKDRIQKHIGTFGITLSPEIRGQGIGKLLMTKLISEAQKNLSELKIITLECFANNKIGLNLYRSLGFIEFGRLPNGLFRLGSYTDEVYMYKMIK